MSFPFGVELNEIVKESQVLISTHISHYSLIIEFVSTIRKIMRCIDFPLAVNGKGAKSKHAASIRNINRC